MMRLTIRLLGTEILHICTDWTCETAEAEGGELAGGTTLATVVGFTASPGDQRWLRRRHRICDRTKRLLVRMGEPPHRFASAGGVVNTQTKRRPPRASRSGHPLAPRGSCTQSGDSVTDGCKVALVEARNNLVQGNLMTGVGDRT